jgi:hypothetical protein
MQTWLIKVQQEIIPRQDTNLIFSHFPAFSDETMIYVCPVVNMPSESAANFINYAEKTWICLVSDKYNFCGPSLLHLTNVRFGLLFHSSWWEFPKLLYRFADSGYFLLPALTVL